MRSGAPPPPQASRSPSPTSKRQYYRLVVDVRPPKGQASEPPHLDWARSGFLFRAVINRPTSGDASADLQCEAYQACRSAWFGQSQLSSEARTQGAQWLDEYAAQVRHTVASLLIGMRSSKRTDDFIGYFSEPICLSDLDIDSQGQRISIEESLYYDIQSSANAVASNKDSNLKKPLTEKDIVVSFRLQPGQEHQLEIFISINPEAKKNKSLGEFAERLLQAARYFPTEGDATGDSLGFFSAAIVKSVRAVEIADIPLPLRPALTPLEQFIRRDLRTIEQRLLRELEYGCGKLWSSQGRGAFSEVLERRFSEGKLRAGVVKRLLSGIQAYRRFELLCCQHHPAPQGLIQSRQMGLLEEIQRALLAVRRQSTVEEDLWLDVQQLFGESYSDSSDFFRHYPRAALYKGVREKRESVTSRQISRNILETMPLDQRLQEKGIAAFAGQFGSDRAEVELIRRKIEAFAGEVFQKRYVLQPVQGQYGETDSQFYYDESVDRLCFSVAAHFIIVQRNGSPHGGESSECLGISMAPQADVTVTCVYQATPDFQGINSTMLVEGVGDLSEVEGFVNGLNRQMEERQEHNGKFLNKLSADVGQFLEAKPEGQIVHAASEDDSIDLFSAQLADSVRQDHRSGLQKNLVEMIQLEIQLYFKESVNLTSTEKSRRRFELEQKILSHAEKFSSDHDGIQSLVRGYFPTPSFAQSLIPIETHQQASHCHFHFGVSKRHVQSAIDAPLPEGLQQRIKFVGEASGESFESRFAAFARALPTDVMPVKRWLLAHSMDWSESNVTACLTPEDNKQYQVERLSAESGSPASILFGYDDATQQFFVERLESYFISPVGTTVPVTQVTQADLQIRVRSNFRVTERGNFEAITHAAAVSLTETANQNPCFGEFLNFVDHASGIQHGSAAQCAIELSHAQELQDKQLLQQMLLCSWRVRRQFLLVKELQGGIVTNLITTEEQLFEKVQLLMGNGLRFQNGYYRLMDMNEVIGLAQTLASGLDQRALNHGLPLLSQVASTVFTLAKAVRRISSSAHSVEEKAFRAQRPIEDSQLVKKIKAQFAKLSTQITELPLKPGKRSTYLASMMKTVIDGYTECDKGLKNKTDKERNAVAALNTVHDLYKQYKWWNWQAKGTLKALHDKSLHKAELLKHLGKKTKFTAQLSKVLNAAEGRGLADYKEKKGAFGLFFSRAVKVVVPDYAEEVAEVSEAADPVDPPATWERLAETEFNAMPLEQEVMTGTGGMLVAYVKKTKEPQWLQQAMEKYFKETPGPINQQHFDMTYITVNRLFELRKFDQVNAQLEQLLKHLLDHVTEVKELGECHERWLELTKDLKRVRSSAPWQAIGGLKEWLTKAEQRFHQKWQDIASLETDTALILLPRASDDAERTKFAERLATSEDAAALGERCELIEARLKAREGQPGVTAEVLNSALTLLGSNRKLAQQKMADAATAKPSAS